MHASYTEDAAASAKVGTRRWPQVPGPGAGAGTAGLDRRGCPRRRALDLMIASTAIAAGLPLYTTNPGDFAGLEDLLALVPVTRPRVHRERSRA
jgi:hypothetical protein